MERREHRLLKEEMKGVHSVLLQKWRSLQFLFTWPSSQKSG